MIAIPVWFIVAPVLIFAIVVPCIVWAMWRG